MKAFLLRRSPGFFLACQLATLGGLLASSSLGLNSLWAQPALPTNSPASLVELRERLAAQVALPRFAAAHWGLEVVSLDTGKRLFAHNASKLFVPASNAKLYSGALALDRFGPDYRIRTSVYGRVPPTHAGLLRGDLILYGRGDPTFAAKFHGGDLAKAVSPLAEAVARFGVRQVSGDLVADESYFRGPALGSGWNWDDLAYYYGAEVSALMLNDNAVDVTVLPGAQPGKPVRLVVQPGNSPLVISNRAVTAAAGSRKALRFYRPLERNVLFISGHVPSGDAGQMESIAIHQPAQWFGQCLRQALQQRGIRLSGRVRTLNWLDREVAPFYPERQIELGAVESPPLGEILGHMLKPSQNQYAQLLLLQVGVAELAVRGSQAAQTPEAAGLRALDRFLRQAGIEPREVSLEEGSGLSRRDLVTPAATVKLLQFMSRHQHAEDFRKALPVAGIDGTLRNRMKGTSAAGNVHAKTGTLSLVHALSGYLTTRPGERLVFSIILNNYAPPEGQPTPRTEIDSLVVLLAGLPWHSASQTE